jgi:hypothetical protein
VPPEKPDERLLIDTLCWQLDAAMDASNATPGLKTIVAIMIAARHARQTSMPASVAAAMLSTYIVRGDPF